LLRPFDCLGRVGPFVHVLIGPRGQANGNGTAAARRFEDGARIRSTEAKWQDRAFLSPDVSSTEPPTIPVSPASRIVSATTSGLRPKPFSRSAVIGTLTRGDRSRVFQHQIACREAIAVG